MKEKVNIATTNKSFVDFRSVTPNTNISKLNLNWSEKDLPERLRTKHVHRLHPYMGKFIPQLVEIFLRKYNPTFVYDPFCGSGTTLVEAKTLGIDSVGTDISAFNVLLTNVKTADYNIVRLRKEINFVLQSLNNIDYKGIEEVKENNEYLRGWFASKALYELKYYLNCVKNLEYSDLFKVILSRSARSARLLTHYDLDFPKKPQIGEYYCYKHRRICRPTDTALKFLKRYTIDTYNRVEEYSKLSKDTKVIVNHNDSRDVDLPKNIDMVFTSPPYIGLIDYHEQHRYAYELLGLKNNEIKEIGPAKKGSSEKARADYIKGINDVFTHTRKFMTNDSYAIIVVNDKYNLYNANNVGFKEVDRIRRNVNRRTGRRDSDFYESILVWKKI